ncbi:MAG: biotin-dependent carboxyltransferase family protein [Pseudomonadota bacterium]
MRALRVHTVGPGVAVQDLGRTGFLAQGLTRGGAADLRAVAENAALLDQGTDCAVLEMVGVGGVFEATETTRIALSGATMAASIDGRAVAWDASHELPAGARLELGAVRDGTYAYLGVGGGFATPLVMGARATHQSTGLGALVQAGDVLPVGADTGGASGLCLPRDARFSGGTVRIVPSMQTADFALEIRARFEAATFRRDARANRQGVRFDAGGAGFSNPEQLSVVSEVIVPGDIQIAGDGQPFVLLAESQTTGGYPRIGTVLPYDLPRVVQAPAGAELRFVFVTLEEGAEIEARARKEWAGLRKAATPLVRNPLEIQDLLNYRLIDGAISAWDAPLDAGED